MIGLSPLSAGHPPSFQPRWVRPSTGSYPRFSLPVDSSPGFASAARDCSPCSDSLSLRLASRLGLAAHRNSLAHSTKGTPSQPRGLLRLLVGTRFQVLFHSPPGVLFTFPSRYWSTIGHRRVFRLGGWPPLLPTGFHVSGGTRVPPGRARGFAYGAVTLSRRPSQAVPLPRAFLTAMLGGPTTPAAVASAPVWPLPLSLATTRGISFDFSSSGYLDVSVPPVAPRRPMRSAGGRRASSPGGFSHSETHGSCGHVPLAVDYRGLSRPSSASCAKASTACPWYPSRRHRRRPSLSRICSCMMRSTNWRIFVCVTLCGSQGAAGAGPGDRTPCASRRDEVRDQRAWSVTGPVRLKMSCLSSGFSLERR